MRLSLEIYSSWRPASLKQGSATLSAPVRRQTAKDYEANLVENLRQLLDRAKAGTYRAPPVKRVHIPKGDGKATRPIGIPTFEDKVLQRAAAMTLGAVYEQDFLNCSYGFRPGRSAHEALESFRKQMMEMRGGWVLEVDIKSFFDTLGHSHLGRILRQRVRDGVLLSLIGKWLNAGVEESGTLSYPEAGSPQGGVISPLLSNVYLHEVLDTWFEAEVKPCLQGKAFLVRYADDLVIGFSNEADARRVLGVLPKRFGKYGLGLHPEKTRLVRFHPPQEPSVPITSETVSFRYLCSDGRRMANVPKSQSSSVRSPETVKERPGSHPGGSSPSQETVAPGERRSFTAPEKLRLVKAAGAAIAGGERGALAELLRQEGIYSSQLATWRRQFGADGEAGLAARRPGRKPKLDAKDRQLLAAKKEVDALERKLRLANALISLQKKAHELLGLTQVEGENS